MRAREFIAQRSDGADDEVMSHDGSYCGMWSEMNSFTASASFELSRASSR